MTLLYDPDDIDRIIQPETTDPSGNVWMSYVDRDGMLIKIVQYASGGTSYSSSEYRGY